MAEKSYDPLAGRTFWNVTRKTLVRTREVWDGFDRFRKETRSVQNTNVPAASLQEATFVASRLTNGRHMPALDLDFRAAIRTSPSGKTYLLLDRKALASEVEAFTTALKAAGIICMQTVIAPLTGTGRLPASRGELMTASAEQAAGRRQRQKTRGKKPAPIPFPPLELAVPAKLLPSSTPGHYHLYVSKEMDWKAYKALLDKALDANIISSKYRGVSVKAKMTMLLKPGLTKTTLAAEAEERKKAAAKKRKRKKLRAKSPPTSSPRESYRYYGHS